MKRNSPKLKQLLYCLFQKKSKKAAETLTFKRPEGMHREVYALLYSDKKYVSWSLILNFIRYSTTVIALLMDICVCLCVCDFLKCFGNTNTNNNDKITQYAIHRDAPPLLPSDTTQGYRTVKAKLGCKKVRPWKWMPFTNPARRDGAIFHHWRRVAEEGKDYPFARFNKVGGLTWAQKIGNDCDFWAPAYIFHSHFTNSESFCVLSLCL